jgi:hypothetical protein
LFYLSLYRFGLNDGTSKIFFVYDRCSNLVQTAEDHRVAYYLPHRLNNVLKCAVCRAGPGARFAKREKRDDEQFVSMNFANIDDDPSMN